MRTFDHCTGFPYEFAQFLAIFIIDTIIPSHCLIENHFSMSKTARLSAINNEKFPLKSLTGFLYGNRQFSLFDLFESSKQIHQKSPASFNEGLRQDLVVGVHLNFRICDSNKLLRRNCVIFNCYFNAFVGTCLRSGA